MFQDHLDKWLDALEIRILRTAGRLELANLSSKYANFASAAAGQMPTITSSPRNYWSLQCSMYSIFHHSINAINAPIALTFQVN